MNTSNSKRIISRTVWMLSIVSLFTDMATEMLYPVMPLYLREIGFSMVAIGILEGVAEAVAGISKGYFGAWSDAINKRMPFVRSGYGLSALSKPLLFLSTSVAWVFFCRTMDRIGKGLRTAPRDALLSAEATAATKGRVFGVHRSMDTLGAMLGPAFAMLFLYFHPGAFRQLFIWAFFPGVAAIICTWLVREKKVAAKGKKSFSLLSSFRYLPSARTEYQRLVWPLLLFTLFNSSDVFLLLRMKDAGLSDTALIGVYIFYNGVYAALAYPFGAMADKLGLKKILITGILLFAAVYLGMAYVHDWISFGVMFLLYGGYAAATEGIAKAWISNVVPKEETATAIGTFEGMRNLCAMAASFIAGVLWQFFGAAVTFTITAIIAVIVAFVLGVLTSSPKRELV